MSSDSLLTTAISTIRNPSLVDQINSKQIRNESSEKRNPATSAPRASSGSVIQVSNPKTNALSIKSDLEINYSFGCEIIPEIGNVHPHERDTYSTGTSSRVGWKRYMGILFALTASVFQSLSSMLAKIMISKGKNYHPLTIAVWRFQGIFWPSIITLLYYAFIRKTDVLRAFKPYADHNYWKIGAFLLLRCIFGTGGNILMFYSFQYLDLADSTVIINSTPVFVTFVAYLFLGESCGITPVLCALLTLCGVAVISRPPWLTGEKGFKHETLIGIAFAFSCMISASMVLVLLRKLRSVHYTVIITIFGVFGSIICLILTAIIHPFQFPRERDHWLLAIALALLTFVVQGSITLALKFEQAGPISLVRTCDVIFAFIWQGIFLYLIPDKFSIIGAVIVITGVLISGLRKWIGTLPEDHKARIKLSFLLS